MSNCKVVITHAEISPTKLRLSAQRVSPVSGEVLSTWTSEVHIPVFGWTVAEEGTVTYYKELAKLALAPRWVYRE